jgi:nitrate/nitrite transporter NarK
MAANPVTPRLAWAVRAAAVAVYFVAVFNRSSLGVAGIIAAHRFGIGASQLAAFTVLQLVVYAGMQIPVGLLVDRYGPRRLLGCGLVIMTTAQLAFALSDSFGTALAARALLGCGDAMSFVSVLRLIAAWFPVRRAPLVTQLTGFTGTAGNLISAYPLSVALRDFGWTPTYLAAALVGGCAIVFPLTVIRNRPAGLAESSPIVTPIAPREPIRAQLRAGWSQTGTRLGLWIHFTTPFSGGVFGLLWGYPFLVQGEGLAPGAAGGLLSLMVAEAMTFGPIYGFLTGRWPTLRLPIALTVVAVTASAWAAVLLWPGRAPIWLLVVLVTAMGTGGAASLIGFEAARADNPGHRVGTVSGMVNVGGFSAMVVLLVAIGLILDAGGSGSAGHYSLAGFKAAFAFQYVLFALGVTQIVRLSRRLRGERDLT